MMGQALSSLDIPITKGTSGIVAFTQKEKAPSEQKVYPCIRCGHCVDACPMFLNPTRMGTLARNGEYESDGGEIPSCTIVSNAGRALTFVRLTFPWFNTFGSPRPCFREQKAREKKAAS